MMDLWASVAGAAWLVVALGALWAVFSPRVDDTAPERLMLAWVCIGSLAASARVLYLGVVSDTALFVALGLAGHTVLAVWRRRP